MMKASRTRRWHLVSLAIAIAFGLVAALVIVAVVATSQAVEGAIRGNPAVIGANLRLALPLANSLNQITFRQSSTLQCWRSGLELLQHVPGLQQQLHQAAESYQTIGVIELSGLARRLPQLAETTDQLSFCTKQSLLFKLLPEQQRQSWLKKISLLEDALAAAQPFFTQDQTWVVMFQNTSELRPTGGFTGSYALIQLKDQTLQTIAVEDIYDADGQVVHFRTAPPGIAEFTSGDAGLRLPDANWWPDFPTSAQTQLDFLADAGKKELTGLIAVNLTLLQQILEITGPVALPDFQATLTPENAPTLLRSHAEDFFPGSRGKKQLLSYALEQLQYQISTLGSEQKGALFALLFRAAATKELQLYSTVPEQQAKFDRLGFAAALNSDQAPVLALVEANVGINKSNQFISRSLAVRQQADDVTAVLYLKNTADQVAPDMAASQSGYVNYQRIVTSPGLSVTGIQTDTNPQPDLTTTSWTSASGLELIEHGLLLSLLPGQTQTVTFTLKRSDPSRPFLLWHQSGTGNTPLTVTRSSGQAYTHEFDSDLLIAP